MTVAEALLKYLETRQAGPMADSAEMVSAVEDLFKATSDLRRAHELEWYTTKRFVDGDHWLSFNTQAGKIVSSTDGSDKKKIRRSINLIRAELRGLKNMVQKIPLTVEAVPNPQNDTPEEKQRAQEEAKHKSAAWRAIEYDLKLRQKIPGMVEDGFIKYAGYIALLPTADGYLEAVQYDGFDVYPDPLAPNFQAASYVFLTPRQQVAALKANKAFENTAELKGEAKLAASQFKESYERAKLGGRAPLEGDLATTIPYQLLIRVPATLEQAQDGSQSVRRLEDGSTRIWIITVAESKLLKVEETTFRRWNIAPYYPEIIGNGVYNRAWLFHLKDLNKSVDSMYSSAEEYFIKNRSKILVPTDSKIKEVTNVQAEVLEYEARNADSIKEYKPAGLPASLFSLLDLGKSFVHDVGGLHPASIGVVPAGVKSGRGIEALKAADAENNVAEPIANLGHTMEELAEIAFELLADHATQPKTLTYPEGEEVQRVTFVGQAGTKLRDGSDASLPPGTVVITPSRVKVTVVPAVSYTEEGKKETLKELFEMGAIDKQTLLEGYRFQNVAEIVERVQVEQAQKAQEAPPPPPVPGDKLITALAQLQKSGEPLTLEVVNAALEQAGLPPLSLDATPSPAQPPESSPEPLPAP